VQAREVENPISSSKKLEVSKQEGPMMQSQSEADVLEAFWRVHIKRPTKLESDVHGRLALKIDTLVLEAWFE
jgi:hypothetical protein